MSTPLIFMGMPLWLERLHEGKRAGARSFKGRAGGGRLAFAPAKGKVGEGKQRTQPAMSDVYKTASPRIASSRPMRHLLDASCRDHRRPPAAGLFVSDRAPRAADCEKAHDPACERFESLFIAGTHCRPGKGGTKA
jgi:hypothetical protein